MKPYALLLLYGHDEHTIPVDLGCTLDTLREVESELRSMGWRIETLRVENDFARRLDLFPAEQWIAFNLCEGSPSQPFYYARVASVLEQGGYGFTGSDALALDETQFKPKMKQLLQNAGVATPLWAAAERAEDLSFEVYPAIVKPAGEHCSFGISRQSVVFDLAEARAQAATIIEQYHAGALIEEFLDSPEYGVALWDTAHGFDTIGISVIQYDGLPDIRDRVCSFDAKWLPETEIYKKTMPICPAPLSPDLRRQVEELAEQSCLACGLRDYGRVDIRLREGRPMALDINANCALSRNAGFPDTARIAGWSYAVVLDRLAHMAAQRAPKPAGARR